QVEDSLAEGLAGDGAGVDAHAAHDFPAFHDGHALAQLRRLDGAALARGAGSDDEQVHFTHDASSIGPGGWQLQRAGGILRNYAHYQAGGHLWLPSRVRLPYTIRGACD